MSLTINHQLNDIINSTGTITINGVAAGGDNTPASFIGNRGLFAGGDTQYTPRDDIDYPCESQDHAALMTSGL